MQLVRIPYKFPVGTYTVLTFLRKESEMTKKEPKRVCQRYEKLMERGLHSQHDFMVDPSRCCHQVHLPDDPPRSVLLFTTTKRTSQHDFKPWDHELRLALYQWRAEKGLDLFSGEPIP